MNLYECLENYKKITLELIEKIKQDNDEFEELIDERSEVLEKIKIINFSLEEIKKIVDDLDIIKLDEELVRLMKVEQVKIKSKMDILKRGRQASKNYNRAFEFQNFFTARSK
ncbi:flagellar protein FliT [Clostridium saccharoperbutylacetonicum]|uniref:flagellar protein FliT n=1 Tax=Clostridium saccharoperbutylacetonicum TaxID=36745 RepID=UPI00098407CE|nr:flagellar protein FliT [Clostridium saccharoperbutylacetonicum]AQR97019.1 flagellar protein FliT [Clostridium saccharoperbutylacetonicum]NSB32898.1 negative regulator of sigma E activity [Clostridium saccharoperbutylacetonicum]